MAGDSSGDDDYMSESLLSNISDVRPGINSESRSQRRFLQIEANRQAAEERAGAARKPKKAELERNLLEEGLNKPIDSGSKGFSLLAKMGYKPGMSLGKKREGNTEGIKEPLAIALKAAKTGLGHETEERERQRDRCEKHLAFMKEQAQNEKVIVNDFRVRKRFAVIQKRLVGDLQRARKTCQELDLRKDLEIPHESWFWPIYKRIKEESASTSDNESSVVGRPRSSTRETDENVHYEYVYANGRSTLEELNVYDWDENELEDKLATISDHMRLMHNYCIWCGCAYATKAELGENCPGPSRREHDDDDDDE